MRPAMLICVDSRAPLMPMASLMTCTVSVWPSEHLALDGRHRVAAAAAVAPPPPCGCRSATCRNAALQPDVDEGALHAGQHPHHLARVRCPQAAFERALDVQLLHRAVLDEGDARLLRRPVDEDVLAGHGDGVWGLDSPHSRGWWRGRWPDAGSACGEGSRPVMWVAGSSLFTSHRGAPCHFPRSPGPSLGRPLPALAVAALLACRPPPPSQYGVATLAAVNDTEVSACRPATTPRSATARGGPQWDPLAGATHYSACSPPCWAACRCPAAHPEPSTPDATSSSSSSRLYVYPGEPLHRHPGHRLRQRRPGPWQTGCRGDRPAQALRPALAPEGTDGRSAARLTGDAELPHGRRRPTPAPSSRVSYGVDGVYSPGDLMPGMEASTSISAWPRSTAAPEAGSYTGGGTPGYWINPIMTWDGPGHMLFTAGYELVGEDDPIGLLMQLTTVGGFGSADFSHTAALTFDLPSNVSFTSASGVFLSATNPGGGGGGGTVPEPSAMA